MQSFDEFLDLFEDLFRRTVSEEDKEEADFASEYAQLVKTLKNFVRSKRNEESWADTFI